MESIDRHLGRRWEGGGTPSPNVSSHVIREWLGDQWSPGAGRERGGKDSSVDVCWELRLLGWKAPTKKHGVLTASPGGVCTGLRDMGFGTQDSRTFSPRTSDKRLHLSQPRFPCLFPGTNGVTPPRAIAGVNEPAPRMLQNVSATSGWGPCPTVTDPETGLERPGLRGRAGVITQDP